MIRKIVSSRDTLKIGLENKVESNLLFRTELFIWFMYIHILILGQTRTPIATSSILTTPERGSMASGSSLSEESIKAFEFATVP
jgi:hypothetical protein